MNDQTKSAPPPATAGEIVEITGPLEAASVTSILATGATTVEVMDAFIYFNAGETVDRRLGPPLSTNARRVLEILRSECAPPEEP